MSQMNRGKFITLEGIDGAGKSTHLSWLENLLEGMGKSIVVTHEPGAYVCSATRTFR
jgi:dTMP kinase